MHCPKCPAHAQLAGVQPPPKMHSKLGAAQIIAIPNLPFFPIFVSIQRSNMRLHTILIFLFIGSTFHLPAQEYLKPPVIHIQSTSIDGIPEEAAGLIVGREGQTIYAITVAHGIKSREVAITFRDNQTTAGRLFRKSDTRDVAIIQFETPFGYQPPSSFALTKQTMTPGMSVKLIGHPYGNRWNINYSNNLNEVAYDFSNDLFTLSSNNIGPGNSGGPVLDSQNEWMGLVKSVDAVKAICINTSLLLQIMDAWGVPINLLTGVNTSQSNGTNSPEDIQYHQYLQEANTAFQNGRWEQAARAYRAADRLKPSRQLKDKIQQCDAELQKDAQYRDALNQGVNADDLSSALDFYQKAQKYRDTETIRLLIFQTEKRLEDIIPPASLSPFRDYKDPLIGDMVAVEGGNFTMGSNEYDEEKPPHSVNVPSFYIGRHEVTQAQWKKIMNGGNPSLNKCNECPVVGVSWYDVQEFIRKLNQQSSHTYRLPTEAEWEYAARGGIKQDDYIYAGSNNVDEVAWYGYSKADKKAHPVGKKKANGLDIYDMSGNVWEWCEDWYHDTYQNAPDNGQAWLKPARKSRVLRGGSWNSRAASMRVASRFRGTPDNHLNFIGFRLTRTP